VRITPEQIELVKNAVALIADAFENEEAQQIISEATTFDETMSILLNAVSEFEMIEVGISERQKQLAERKKRAQESRDVVRQIMHELLSASGMKKFMADEATVGLQAKPPSVEILDDSLLADSYVRIKKEADKAAIKTALSNGIDVAGARLIVGGESLVIRRK
jgi:hypothetical protein